MAEHRELQEMANPSHTLRSRQVTKVTRPGVCLQGVAGLCTRLERGHLQLSFTPWVWHQIQSMETASA